MSATLLKSNKEEATFLIQIDANTFIKALIEEYNKTVPDDDRKKAPSFLSNKALLGQLPGLEIIAGKALEKIMPAFYINAIKELGLHPMSFPKIMPRATELGKPCVVEVTVTLEPELELKQFEGLEAAYTPVCVTEDDVAVQLAGLRRQYNADNNDAILLEKLACNSIEIVQKEIRNSLTSMAEEKTDYNRKEAVLKQLIEANPFVLKEEIIAQQVMIEVNQISKQMGPQVMQNYLKTSGRNIDDLKREVRPQAEATVRQNLLLSAVAEKLSLEVTEEDIKEAVTKQPSLFMDFSTDYETRRKRLEEMPGALDQLIHSVRLEKATDYLVSKAILQQKQPAKILDVLPEYMKYGSME